MKTETQDRTLAYVYENTKEILSIIKSKQGTEAKSSNENNSDHWSDNGQIVDLLAAIQAGLERYHAKVEAIAVTQKSRTCTSTCPIWPDWKTNTSIFCSWFRTSTAVKHQRKRSGIYAGKSSDLSTITLQIGCLESLRSCRIRSCRSTKKWKSKYWKTAVYEWLARLWLWSYA